jgi:hypothetical protein
MGNRDFESSQSLVLSVEKPDRKGNITGRSTPKHDGSPQAADVDSSSTLGDLH